MTDMTYSAEYAEPIAVALDAAADYIDEHGWCQHTPNNEAGAVCIEGALCRVAGTWEARWLLVKDLGTAANVWNDMPGREQWEVTELLRDTAKKVRHGELR